jgi:hypothetical protein
MNMKNLQVIMIAMLTLLGCSGWVLLGLTAGAKVNSPYEMPANPQHVQGLQDIAKDNPFAQSMVDYAMEDGVMSVVEAAWAAHAIAEELRMQMKGKKPISQRFSTIKEWAGAYTASEHQQRKSAYTFPDSREVNPPNK